MSKRLLKLAALSVPAILSVGCATQPTASYDYRAFEASNPHSILVLPPVNNSPDVSATFGVYAQLTQPLAEAGFYVLPVAVVNETFKQNGLTTATDIHSVDPKKLQQIFGADAALYMTITQYGTKYAVLASVTTVAAEAKLVDLKTGAVLWNNRVVVVDNGGSGNSGGGLAGLLVEAVVKQVINSALDKAYLVARTANERLLAGGQVNGLLYGPRSPNYKGRNSTFQRPTLASSPQDVKLIATAAPAFGNASTSTLAATDGAQTSTAPVDVGPAFPIARAAMVTEVTPALPEPIAHHAAVAPAAPLSGPEQRYAEALGRAQAQHEALDPTSNWYRSELLEWVMERKAEFIRAGHAPDVALQRALALMKGN